MDLRGGGGGGLPGGYAPPNFSKVGVLGGANSIIKSVFFIYPYYQLGLFPRGRAGVCFASPPPPPSHTMLFAGLGSSDYMIKGPRLDKHPPTRCAWIHPRCSDLYSSRYSAYWGKLRFLSQT